MNCSSFEDTSCVEPGICEAGCACPDGLTLDDNGDCIDISSCPSLCSYEGSYFPENFVLLRNAHKWYVLRAWHYPVRKLLPIERR